MSETEEEGAFAEQGPNQPMVCLGSGKTWLPKGQAIRFCKPRANPLHTKHPRNSQASCWTNLSLEPADGEGEILESTLLVSNPFFASFQLLPLSSFTKPPFVFSSANHTNLSERTIKWTDNIKVALVLGSCVLSTVSLNCPHSFLRQELIPSPWRGCGSRWIKTRLKHGWAWDTLWEVNQVTQKNK